MTDDTVALLVVDPGVGTSVHLEARRSKSGTLRSVASLPVEGDTAIVTVTEVESVVDPSELLQSWIRRLSEERSTSSTDGIEGPPDVVMVDGNETLRLPLTHIATVDGIEIFRIDGQSWPTFVLKRLSARRSQLRCVTRSFEIQKTGRRPRRPFWPWNRNRHRYPG